MTETIINSTVLLCQLVKQYTSAAEEEAMYLSLPEVSRDSFSTFMQRCTKCAKKAFVSAGYSLPGYYQDYNSTYHANNQKLLIRRNEYDSFPTASVTCGRLHICYENEFQSNRYRTSPNIRTRTNVCRENFEKHYWRKSITEWDRPLKDQIVVSAIVTVRDSGGNVGFPDIPNFELGNVDGRHNHLYTFMYYEFVNQKSLINMLLKGITNQH